jgi:hypothetical protein
MSDTAAKAQAQQARLENFIRKQGSEVVRNPNHSVIGVNIPKDIRLYHLYRALTVLQVNQQMGRFTKTDFDTFVGPGAANRVGDTSNRRVPPGTTRRALGTLTPEWAENYLPFPGRIYFTSATGAGLWAAIRDWLVMFSSTAAKSGATKNHPYRFASSLSFWVNGAKVGIDGLQARTEGADVGTTVQIINIAPQASTVELYYGAMYDATRAIFLGYAPGLGIDYGFINSDAVGLRYGKGTGGPSRPGKASPVVYALPMVTLFIPTSGKSNTTLRPLGVHIKRRTKGGKPVYRKIPAKNRLLGGSRV